MASIKVQELRRWPNKPRRFSVEEINIAAEFPAAVASRKRDRQAKLDPVFHLRIGQILHLDEMAGMRVDGVNIIIQRGHS